MYFKLIHRFLVVLGVFCLLIAGCGEKTAKKTTSEGQAYTDDQRPIGEAIETGGVVHFGSMKAMLPEGWVPVPPTSSKRKAQFKLKPIETDLEAGKLAVYYYGPNVDDIEININRWYGQFEQQGSRPTVEVAKREMFESNGLKITLISFTGTRRPSPIDEEPIPSKKSNWMNMSAVVETPEGPWFFKGTGPEKTMKYHTDNMKQFLMSLKYLGDT